MGTVLCGVVTEFSQNCFIPVSRIYTDSEIESTP